MPLLDIRLAGIMRTIKEEVVDDKFIENIKDFVKKVDTQTAIIFVCNTSLAERHLMTMNPTVMFSDPSMRLIKAMAYRHCADGIITIVNCLNVDGQRCMSVTIETLLDRHEVFYPYEKTHTAQGPQVTWKDPVQTSRSALYAALLPPPPGMAQA